MEEGNFYLTELFEEYGALLTDNQREIFRLSCLCDLSLGEIAELKNTSRQSVNDTLSKAKKQLTDLESKLKLAGRRKELFKLAEELKTTDVKSAEKLQKILEES